jgi:S-adenosylmethionine-diacylgycerolhomoserine-N-methlytransferase
MATRPFDPADVHDRMERMYRPQRHVYDLTRKWYLLGRDPLLDGIEARPGQRLLEIGCGTGRNLVRLGRRLPGVLLCGVEPARSMLATAAAALRRHGLAGRARLAYGTAQALDPARDLGVEAFDHVVLSYCLSIIERPLPALERAIEVLAPGGVLHLVDFGPMDGMPPWAAAGLRAWLERFGVHHRPEVGIELRRRAARGEGRLEETELAGGYAELRRLTLAR